MVAKPVLMAVQAVIVILGQGHYLTAIWGFAGEDCGVERSGGGQGWHCTGKASTQAAPCAGWLAVCLVVCLAVCLSACPGFSIDPAALSTVLQHPNKVELGRPSLVSGAWH